ncbi:MAG: response regulator [Thermodesulfovibrionales bacterium]|nr:response regulator [Thermodesulfovibrionales bacterium]
MAKLLLADDSITIQKVVELVLADEGFEIKAANNGADAFNMLTSFRPDIILADIEMPKMNGYQLCEKVKSDPGMKDIPVMLLAGAFEPLDEELAKKVGANDFLIKPFESEDLIKKINALLIAFAAQETAEAASEEVAEVVEALAVEDDLWGMEEETGAAPFAEEEMVAEAVAEEFDPVEAAEVFAEAEAVSEAGMEDISFEDISAVDEALLREVSLPDAEVEIEMEKPRPMKAEAWTAAAPAPVMPALSSDDLLKAFMQAADERVGEAIKGLDLKEALLANIASSIKDSVEKVLWEVAPELTERIAREALKDAMASLTKEIEKVIWETVPDLAESLIKKEIEKIKSEM